MLATQTLIQKKPANMRIEVSGGLLVGTTAKDLALAMVGTIGAAGANGHVIEFCGSTIRALDMAGRMTVCNMAVEGGARAGLIAPDRTTFDYIRGRPYAPTGEAFEKAVAWWRTPPSDPDALYDRSVMLDVSALAPMVTWGTNPEAVVPIDGCVPEPRSASDARMLEYRG